MKINLLWADASNQAICNISYAQFWEGTKISLCICRFERPQMMNMRHDQTVPSQCNVESFGFASDSYRILEAANTYRLHYLHHRVFDEVSIY